MTSLLRQIVAGPRAKHDETGLDLCYVTEDIIATYAFLCSFLCVPMRLFSIPRACTSRGLWVPDQSELTHE